MAASYVINCRWALGDTVCLSAVVRDIALAFPGQFSLAMNGHYANVYWHNNPYVVPLNPALNAPVLNFDYSTGIVASRGGSKIHFLSWFHREFERLTGMNVPVLKPKGDIHLSLQEKKRQVPIKRYWDVIAGGKLDLTAKIWHTANFQTTVNRLAKLGIPCVQAGGVFNGHIHPTLQNCYSMLGKTKSERDFFSLIYNAEGVICGITSAMHIAAAFDKPCVVIAGGREDPPWEAYVNNFNSFGPKCEPVLVPHRFLHTIGLIDCGCDNRNRGCWKARTVPIEEADLTNHKKKDKLCTRPVRDKGQPVPACMDLITPDMVVDAVMSYFEDGTLPPISAPTGAQGCKLRPEDAVVIVPHNYPLVDSLGNVVGHSGDALAYPPMPAGPPPVLLNQVTYDDLVKWETNAPSPIPLPREFVGTAEENSQFRVLDNPILGGKVTIFVLTWGDNRKLISGCLESIINSVPAHRRDIRVAMNQPSKSSLDYVQAFSKDVITKVYADLDSPNNPNARRKYPVMREMFWDKECPITTPYVVWFDDDTIAIDKLWLPKLAETIIANHNQGARLYGWKMQHDLTMYAKGGHRPEKWFQEATWWKGEQLRLRGREMLAPNGSCIDFVSGYFWALATEAIRKADIPDVRLGHNGGDVTLGAQIHQAGFKIKMFNESKANVWCPTKQQGGRRGFSEAFPWADPQTRANHKSGL